MPLKFRNWQRFQHYRNRTPPWIKLHRALLTDPDYHTMPDRSAKYLPLAWIVASEDSGVLPDCKRLAFILRVAVADIQGMMNDWKPFLECTCDSSMLASCKQLAPVPLCLSVCLPLSCSLSESQGGDGGTVKLPGQMPPDGWTIEHVIVTAAKPTVGVTEAMARTYFDVRTKVGWVDATAGGGRPVARSQSGLESDLRHWKVLSPTHDAERKQREDRAKGGPASAYPESTASLQKRIDAASLELGTMPRKDRDKTAEQIARAASLRERIGAWQKQIAGG